MTLNSIYFTGYLLGHLLMLIILGQYPQVCGMLFSNVCVCIFIHIYMFWENIHKGNYLVLVIVPCFTVLLIFLLCLWWTFLDYLQYFPFSLTFAYLSKNKSIDLIRVSLLEVHLLLYPWSNTNCLGFCIFTVSFKISYGKLATLFPFFRGILGVLAILLFQHISK